MEYNLSDIPVVKPKWKRSIQTIDIQPLDGQRSEHICTACNKNKARYSCPKCMARYCSAACYKVHDIPPGMNHEGGGRCTEQFYRNKVKEVTDLDVKDEKNISQMRDILTRRFYNDGIEEEGSHDDKEDDMPISLSDEDVIDLMESGLNWEEDVNEIADEDVDIKAVPQAILKKFETAVQRGELSHMVQQWSPFSTSSNAKGPTDVFTLDERILAIPSLFPSGDLRQPQVHLENNICEVIFVITWTFRAYDCFAHMYQLTPQVPENAMEIALHLQAKSNVLSHDARYDNLKHVLMDCCQRIRQDVVQHKGVISSAESEKVDWRILAKDLLSICRCRRILLKTLFYANDTIDKAIIDLKQIHGKSSKDSRKMLVLARKKLQYFQSWCQSYWDSCSNEVTMGIEEWIADWNPRKEEIVVSSQDDMLLLEKAIHLKNTKDQSIHHLPPKPLLVPVKTKIISSNKVL